MSFCIVHLPPWRQEMTNYDHIPIIKAVARGIPVLHRAEKKKRGGKAAARRISVICYTDMTWRILG